MSMDIGIIQNWVLIVSFLLISCVTVKNLNSEIQFYKIGIILCWWHLWELKLVDVYEMPSTECAYNMLPINSSLSLDTFF